MDRLLLWFPTYRFVCDRQQYNDQAPKNKGPPPRWGQMGNPWHHRGKEEQQAQEQGGDASNRFHIFPHPDTVAVHDPPSQFFCL